jgi:aspartate/methionine/tyrosine aminotransferase
MHHKQLTRRYAMRAWNHSSNVTWRLFGHSHERLTALDNSLSMDVGADASPRRTTRSEAMHEPKRVPHSGGRGSLDVVLRVPATRSDEDLALALVEKKNVYVHPGHFYDFPGDGYLVASLSVPEEDFSNGVTRLLGLVDGET